MKSSTAFNASFRLSQTNFGLSKGNPSEQASFTDRLLDENSFQKIIQKNQIKPPQRSLSTEERDFLQCTFNPNKYQTPARYLKVKPRIKCYLIEPQTKSNQVSPREKLSN